MSDTDGERISQQDMAVLIKHEAARPLMAGYDPVPVSYAERWWQVPAEAAPDAPYVHASPEQHELFTDLAQRLAMADAAVARDAWEHQR